MVRTLHQRLITPAAPTPAEDAAILFGTTAATTGAMAASIVLAMRSVSLQSVITGSTLHWLSAGTASAVALLLAYRILAHGSNAIRGRMLLAAVAIVAMLVGAGLASSIGAGEFLAAL
jgi:hypothetical protein